MEEKKEFNKKDSKYDNEAFQYNPSPLLQLYNAKVKAKLKQEDMCLLQNNNLYTATLRLTSSSREALSKAYGVLLSKLFVSGSYKSKRVARADVALQILQELGITCDKYK